MKCPALKLAELVEENIKDLINLQGAHKGYLIFCPGERNVNTLHA
jgi:hypothetical protein